MSILGDIVNIRGALQQQKLNSSLDPLAIQQQQQSTQLGQQNLNYQTAMNAAILRALQTGQPPPQGAAPPQAPPQAQPQAPPGGLLASVGTPAPATPGVSTMPLSNPQATQGLMSGALGLINSAQPHGGLWVPPGAPQPQQPQQQPSWFAPPSANDISSLPVGGLPASLSSLLAIHGGKAPADAQKDTYAAQLMAAKQQYDPIVQSISGIVQSDNPVRDINANPMMQATWQHYAQARGLDPTSDLNATNARQVFGSLANMYRSQLGETATAPPIPLQTIKLPDGRTAQVDPVTGKQTILAPSPLSPVLGADNRPVNVPTAQAAGRTPYSPFAATQAEMSGPAGALDAALTAAGVTVPGGRGGQLYAQKLANLIKANPGVPPEQIADQVRTGQLDFNGAKRSTGQLSQVLASTTSFGLQLEKNLDNLAGAQSAVDATGVPILNRAFASFKQNISGGKDIAKYTAFFNAAASEYAKIISGGTGVAAPSVGDMAEARKVMIQAYTSGGLEGLRDALTTEANNKRDSYQEGLNAAARTSTSTSTPAPINVPGTRPPTTGAPASTPTDIQALLKKYGGR